MKLAKKETKEDKGTRRLQDLQDLQAKDYDRRYLHPSWRLACKISNPAKVKWKEHAAQVSHPHRSRSAAAVHPAALGKVRTENTNFNFKSLSRVIIKLESRRTSLDFGPAPGRSDRGHQSLVGLCCLVDCSWSE